MKLITICIPTFNRSEFVISQLNFLLNEITSYKNIIEIKVADNCSSDFHREKLIEFHSKNDDFELILNNENLGLIGNINLLASKTSTEYVWFLGDDDTLRLGILSQIVNILSLNTVNYVYLNFDAFYDTEENIVSSNNLLEFSGLVENQDNFAVNFFKENGTACMFMSSAIHKTDTILNLIKYNRKKSITDPLLYFFASAKSPIYIEEKVFVLDRLSQISWADQQRDVFSWKVPYTLVETNEILDYDRNQISGLLYEYYKKEKNFAIMLVKAPSDVKVKILKLLKGKRINLLINSLAYLISVVLKKVFK